LLIARWFTYKTRKDKTMIKNIRNKTIKKFIINVFSILFGILLGVVVSPLSLQMYIWFGFVPIFIYYFVEKIVKIFG
jgi:hypothetical protein